MNKELTTIEEKVYKILKSITTKNPKAYIGTGRVENISKVNNLSKEEVVEAIRKLRDNGYIKGTPNRRSIYDIYDVIPKENVKPFNTLQYKSDSNVEIKTEPVKLSNVEIVEKAISELYGTTPRQLFISKRNSNGVINLGDMNQKIIDYTHLNRKDYEKAMLELRNDLFFLKTVNTL